jgi:HAD superfamily hydrolase (TIGR01509 family)
VDGPIQAIFFDNDGVLVDTEGLYYRANREVLAAHDVALDEAAYVQLFLREGTGAWHLLSARGADDAAVAAARAARDRRYLELIDRPGTLGGFPSPPATTPLGEAELRQRDTADLLLPGVADAVRALAGRFRLGIVTSSQPASFARVHARAGILPSFEFALTREQYGRSKPDPEPYLCALARVGLPPARCLVIEDSERGLIAAKAAGLACWVVPSALTRGGDFTAADAVLPDLAAVAARVSGWRRA